jgi:hypothetical protein
MGTIKQGILGGFSGKVGTVIGGIWKGITYMRGIAPSHSDAQTDAQLTQRMKFAVTMQFLQPVSQFLKIGWKNYAVKMTAVNAAFSYNFHNALLGTYPNFTINYAKALLAHGTLTPALNPVASSTAASVVTFSWDNNSTEIGASSLDKTLIVVYNGTKNQAVYFDGLTDRATVTQTVSVPGSFKADTVQCYIAFISVDGQLVSDSLFAGAVVVL